MNAIMNEVRFILDEWSEIITFTSPATESFYNQCNSNIPYQWTIASAGKSVKYCITRFFHGKLSSRFGIYPNRGSYFRRRKIRV